MQKDLFGNDILDEQAMEKPRERGGSPPAVATPAPVGSGPNGETCKTCRFSYAREFSQRYWKCALVKATRGEGTDIRIKWAACSQWDARGDG